MKCTGNCFHWWFVTSVHPSFKLQLDTIVHSVKGLIWVSLWRYVKHMGDSISTKYQQVHRLLQRATTKTTDERKTYTTGSFWAETCSANGYIVLVGKWAAGRLFPASGALVVNSLRKALMTPRCIQTAIPRCAWPFLQRSLDTWMHLVHSTKGVKVISRRASLLMFTWIRKKPTHGGHVVVSVLLSLFHVVVCM